MVQTSLAKANLW